VYRYFGEEVPLRQVIEEVPVLSTGGTLAVALACHALARGFDATIYTYNLQIFDPTWFSDPAVDLSKKLRAQLEVKQDHRLEMASGNYLEFFRRGGKLRFEELDAGLLRRYLKRRVPILTGLSATYLYGSPRERDDDDYDDVRGEPAGHFVVLCGYDAEKREIMVADPLRDNPRFGSQYYSVGVDRLVNAVLLGIVTYDANLLIITPAGKKTWRP
jgi:hypothetical protein